jgi:inner membrane transporter RhtA
MRPPGDAGVVPPQVLVVTGAISVQTGAAVATRLFDDLGATGVLALRVGVAAVVLALVTRLWKVRLRRDDLPAVLGYAAVLGGMNLLFYLAIERIPLGVGVALELVGPTTVALLGSRRALDLVWTALAASGVLVLVAPRFLAGSSAGGLDLAGVVLALAAGACWGGYIVLGARMGARVPGTAGLAWALLVASVVLVPLGMVGAGSALLEPPLLLAGAGVALLSAVLPYSLELTALRRVSTRVFGMMTSLQPAVATLAGFVVAAQRPGLVPLVGIALVVAASLGAAPWGRRRDAGSAEPDVPTMPA